MSDRRGLNIVNNNNFKNGESTTITKDIPKLSSVRRTKTLRAAENTFKKTNDLNNNTTDNDNLDMINYQTINDRAQSKITKREIYKLKIFSFISPVLFFVMLIVIKIFHHQMSPPFTLLLTIFALNFIVFLIIVNIPNKLRNSRKKIWIFKKILITPTRMKILKYLEFLIFCFYIEFFLIFLCIEFSLKSNSEFYLYLIRIIDFKGLIYFIIFNALFQKNSLSIVFLMLINYGYLSAYIAYFNDLSFISEYFKYILICYFFIKLDSNDKIVSNYMKKNNAIMQGLIKNYENSFLNLGVCHIIMKNERVIFNNLIENDNEFLNNYDSESNEKVNNASENKGLSGNVVFNRSRNKQQVFDKSNKISRCESNNKNFYINNFNYLDYNCVINNSKNVNQGLGEKEMTIHNEIKPMNFSSNNINSNNLTSNNLNNLINSNGIMNNIYNNNNSIKNSFSRSGLRNFSPIYYKGEYVDYENYSSLKNMLNKSSLENILLKKPKFLMSDNISLNRTSSNFGNLGQMGVNLNSLNSQKLSKKQSSSIKNPSENKETNFENFLNNRKTLDLKLRNSFTNKTNNVRKNILISKIEAGPSKGKKKEFLFNSNTTNFNKSLLHFNSLFCPSPNRAENYQNVKSTNSNFNLDSANTNCRLVKKNICYDQEKSFRSNFEYLGSESRIIKNNNTLNNNNKNYFSTLENKDSKITVNKDFNFKSGSINFNNGQIQKCLTISSPNNTMNANNTNLNNNNSNSNNNNNLLKPGAANLSNDNYSNLNLIIENSPRFIDNINSEINTNKSNLNFHLNEKDFQKKSIIKAAEQYKKYADFQFDHDVIDNYKDTKISNINNIFKNESKASTNFFRELNILNLNLNKQFNNSNSNRILKENKLFFKSLDFFNRKFNQRFSFNSVELFSDDLMENLVRLDSIGSMFNEDVKKNELEVFSLKHCLDMFVTKETNKEKILIKYTNTNKFLRVPTKNINKVDASSMKSFDHNNNNSVNKKSKINLKNSNSINNPNSQNAQEILYEKDFKSNNVHSFNKSSEKHVTHKHPINEEIDNSNLNKFSVANNNSNLNNKLHIINHDNINKQILMRSGEHHLPCYQDQSNFSSSDLNSNSEISNGRFSEKFFTNVSHEYSKNSLNLKYIINTVQFNNNNNPVANSNSLEENIKLKSENKLFDVVNNSSNNIIINHNQSTHNVNDTSNQMGEVNFNKLKKMSTHKEEDEIFPISENLNEIDVIHENGNSLNESNHIKIEFSKKPNDVNNNINNNNFRNRLFRSSTILDTKKSNMFCFSTTFAGDKKNNINNKSTIKDYNFPEKQQNEDNLNRIIQEPSTQKEKQNINQTNNNIKENLRFIAKKSETPNIRKETEISIKKLDKTVENSLFNVNNTSEKNLFLIAPHGSSKINLLNGSKKNLGLNNNNNNNINQANNKNLDNLNIDNNNNNFKNKKSAKSSVLETLSKSLSIGANESKAKSAMGLGDREALDPESDANVEYFNLGLFMLRRINKESDLTGKKKNTNIIHSKTKFFNFSKHCKKENKESNIYFYNNFPNINNGNNPNNSNNNNDELKYTVNNNANSDLNEAVSNKSVIIENKKTKAKSGEIFLSTRFKNKMTFKGSNLNQKKLFETLLTSNLCDKRDSADPNLANLIFNVTVAKHKNNDNYIFEIFIQVLPDFLAFIPKTLLGNFAASALAPQQNNLANNNIDAFKAEKVDEKKEATINNAILEFERNMKKNLAKIIHEFKTPINTIISLISDLNSQRNLNSNKSNKILNLINNMSNYVVFLTKDIIQFCNIGSADKNSGGNSNNENFNFQKSEVKLKKIIHFCFEILRTLLQCKDAKSNIDPILTFDKEIEEYYIITDELRLKQIILNLISNAIKFTKSGSIELKCKLKQKKIVKIYVKDTGIGIREEEKAKLFQDFVMLKDQERLNQHGSGLGLSICKFLANKLNHQLKFKSKHNEGSCFYLILNCHKKFQKNYTHFKSDHFALPLEKTVEGEGSGKNILKFNTERRRHSSFYSLKDFEDEVSEDYDNNDYNHDNERGYSSNEDTKITMINTNVFEFRYNLDKSLYYSKSDHNKINNANPNTNNNLNTYNNGNSGQICNNNFNKISNTYINKNNQNLLNQSKNSELMRNSSSERSFSQSFIMRSLLKQNKNLSSNKLEKKHLTGSANEEKNDKSRHSSSQKYKTKTNRWGSIKNRNFESNKNVGRFYSKEHASIARERNFSINNSSQHIDLAYNVSGKNSKKARFNLNNIISMKMKRGSKKMRSNTNLNRTLASSFHEKNLNRMKILVVDDNQHLRSSVTKILKDVLLSHEKSFEIIEAQDGIDILKHVMEDQKNRNLLKCVFTDECMEYMNGSQAIEIIRMMEQQNKIKKVNIVCVTSFEDEYNREMILNKGADYIMEKPCNKPAIVKLLADLNLL